jgi:hypothetical protein
VGKKNRTDITIETERVLVIRRRKGSALAWCQTCDQQVPMIKVDEAAALSRVSSRTVFRWVEAEKIHFVETPEGLLLICLSSLAGNNLARNTPEQIGQSQNQGR